MTLPRQGESCAPARVNCWGLAQEQNIISKILLSWSSGVWGHLSHDVLIYCMPQMPSAPTPASCRALSTVKWQLLHLPIIVQKITLFLDSQAAFSPPKVPPFSTQTLAVVTCWSQCCTGPFPPGWLHTPWTGRSWLEWGHSQWHQSSSGQGWTGEPSRENLLGKLAWVKKEKKMKVPVKSPAEVRKCLWLLRALCACFPQRNFGKKFLFSRRNLPVSPHGYADCTFVYWKVMLHMSWHNK